MSQRNTMGRDTKTNKQTKNQIIDSVFNALGLIFNMISMFVAPFSTFNCGIVVEIISLFLLVAYAMNVTAYQIVRPCVYVVVYLRNVSSPNAVARHPRINLTSHYDTL